MKINKIFFAVVFAGTALSSFSVYSAEDSSLNALIDEARQNNPQILAARQRFEAAKARVTLTRTLDDPELSYEYDKITPGINESMSPMRMFGVSQNIPFPTKLWLRKQSAGREAAALEQEFKETELSVINEIKQAYYQLFLNQKKTELTRENQALLNQFVSVVNSKYSANKATQQDSLKAQVEYSKVSNQLILFEQEEKIAQSLLTALLSRQENTEFGSLGQVSPQDLELDENKVMESAKENRPELQSFREMLDKSAIDLTLARQEYLPDFSVEYRREERDGRMGEWAGMVGVTFPLWFGGKQNSFVKEARANSAVAKAEYQAAENTVLFEARSALAKFTAAKKLAKIYESGVLPQARAALATAIRGYQSDQITFLDLLDSQRSLWEFQMEYYEAVANLEIALADLERSVGKGLVQ